MSSDEREGVRITVECYGCNRRFTKIGVSCAAAQSAFDRAGWYVEWWVPGSPRQVGVALCRACHQGLPEQHKKHLPSKMIGIGMLYLPGDPTGDDGDEDVETE